MAREAILRTISEVAAADLTAKQYYAVTIGSGGANVSTAGKNMDGVLQNKPNPTATSGELTAEIAIDGITKVAISANTAITKGGLLEVDTGGTFIPNSGGFAVAKALESLTSNANVCLITAAIIRNNLAFT